MITLNLLPPEEKKNLYLKKVNELLWIYSGQILIAFFVFVLLSGLIWFYLSSQIKIVDKELNSYEIGIKKEAFDELNKKIEKANAQIMEIQKIQADHNYFSQLFEELVGLIPAGIRLENISIQPQATTKKETARITMNISGHAPTRDNVIKIKEGLENSIYFDEVESPLSNLVKAADIDFTFSAIINQKQLKK